MGDAVNETAQRRDGLLISITRLHDYLEFGEPDARSKALLSPVLAALKHCFEAHWSTMAARKAGLTTRELEITALVCQGKPTKQIASELFVTENTVRSHLQKTMAKLGVTSRTALAMWAVKQGIVEVLPETYEHKGVT